MIPDRVKVRVCHGFLGSGTLLMVESKALVEEIQGLVISQDSLVSTESRPRQLLESLLPEDVILLGQLQAVLLQVLGKVRRTQNFNDLDQLVVIVLAMEEDVFAEDDTSQHAAKAPQVQ